MSIEQSLSMLGAAEVLITLKDFKDATDSLTLTTAKTIGAGLARCFTTGPGSRLSAVAAAAGLRKPKQGYRVYRHLGMVLGTVDAAGLKQLLKHKSVQEVAEVPELSLIRPEEEPVAALAAAAAPFPPGPTWGIRRLKIDKLWEKGLTGKGVLVAHLDTGIDGDHPGLKPAIAKFAEFNIAGDLVPNALPRDSGNHGTHTAGTIAGRPVDGVQYGVAPEALLLSAMVIEKGDIIRRILGGMDWAVGNKAKILSMSLGIRGVNQSFLALMQNIRGRGILPVIAVGNEGPATSRSPGNYDEVLSVGAFDETDKVWDKSSSQQMLQPQPRWVPDLVAPGVRVISAKRGGGFLSWHGSSMATPHIAGLAALLFQAKPRATVDEVETAIFKSCSRPSTITVDRGNRGIPDAVKAHQLLLAGAVSPPPIKKVAKKTTKKGASKRPPAP
ncbi:MAG: S8 family serine peptidase [Planctomycetaceae bacterium]|nr:S8 family serine peptidase [Planctomycetaceae bacterium]